LDNGAQPYWYNNDTSACPESYGLPQLTTSNSSCAHAPAGDGIIVHATAP
jgi:hypothetical protein